MVISTESCYTPKIAVRQPAQHVSAGPCLIQRCPASPEDLRLAAPVPRCHWPLAIGACMSDRPAEAGHAGVLAARSKTTVQPPCSRRRRCRVMPERGRNACGPRAGSASVHSGRACRHAIAHPCSRCCGPKCRHRRQRCLIGLSPSEAHCERRGMHKRACPVVRWCSPRPRREMCEA